jgi:hypothetical protein
MPTDRRSLYSATRIRTYRDCPRKWWYGSVAQQVQHDTAGTSLGTDAHDRMARYLAGEMPDPRTALELSGDALIAPYLAAGAHAPLVEHNFVLDVAACGVQLTGAVDAYFSGARVGTVVDHKFLRDVGRYARTEEDLRVDEQCAVYLKWAADYDPRPSHFVFTHHNHQTAGYNRDTQQFKGRRPKVLAVSVTKTRAEIAADFAALEDTLRAMRHDALATDPCGVPADNNACSNYGGCPFAVQCTSSTRNKDWLDPTVYTPREPEDADGI